MAITRRVRPAGKLIFVVLATLGMVVVKQSHDYLDELDKSAQALDFEPLGTGYEMTAGRKLSSDFSLIGLAFGDECQHLAEFLLLVPYIIFCIYTFLGLAIICDDYFVASLERIVDFLRLPDDVAGATFMAAGSSAPELFTSIIGVFLTSSNVGVGTIVGSAIFNILIIIGITALLAGQTLHLDWRPLTRDSICYGISILLLLVSFIDGKVYWWESLIFVLFYVFYIGIMFVNKWLMQGMSWLQFKITGTRPPMDQESEGEKDQEAEEAVEEFVEGENGPGVIEMSSMNADERTRAESVPLTKPKLSAVSSSPAGRSSAAGGRLSQFMPAAHVDGTRVSFDKGSSASGRPSLDTRRVGYAALNPRMKWKVAVAAIIAGHRWIDAMKEEEGGEKNDNQPGPDKVTREIVGDNADGSSAIDNMEGAPQDPEIPEDEAVEKGFKYWVTFVADWILKILSIPYTILFVLTVPDCKKDDWRKWTFPITFVMSIFWIGVLSFFMVDFAARSGCIVGIPDYFMGLTFIAAGTSVPDALGSVIVAKEGKGDMAIANALGSNVFDICFGLAFPWFVKTAFFDLGGSIDVSADGIIGLLMFVAILFLILFLVYGLLAIRLFKLSPFQGWIFLGGYGVFVIYALIWNFAVRPFI